MNIDPSNPAFICSTCTDSIKIFAKFKRKAQKSDEFFNQKSQKFEQNFWQNLKSENLSSSPLIKQEPEVMNNISYWVNIGNIANESISSIKFIDENEKESGHFYDNDGDEQAFNHSNDYTENEFADSCTDNSSNFIKVAGPKSKTLKIQAVTTTDIKFESTSSTPPPTSSRNRAIPCKLCGKRVSSNKSLELHMSVVHNTDNKVYTCSHCQKIFKHISYIKKHVETHHDMSYQKSRDVVIKVIRNREKSPVEFKEKHPTFDPEIFGNKVTKNCKLCGREFSSTRSCRDHMVIAHKAAKEVYVCKICDSRFKLKDYLARHMKNKHQTTLDDDNHSVHEQESEEEEYEEIDKDIVDMARPQTRTSDNHCHECDKRFSSTRSYSEHMKIRHKSDNKIYICKFCDEKFIVPSYLKKHVKKLHNHTLKAHEIIVKRKDDSIKKKVRNKKELRSRVAETQSLSEEIVNSMQAECS